MAMHHIIPFHEWKNRINSNATRYNREFNSLDNIVELTTEQHAQAHQFLYELFNKFEDFLAWKMILGQIGKEEAQKLIARNTGKKNKGRKHTIETKRLMSKSRIGQKRSEEAKKNMSIAQHNLSPEAKQQRRELISKSKVGIPRTQQTKDKISITRAKNNWEITFPNNHITIVQSLTRFCKDHTLHQGNMSRVAKGDLQHLRGYKCQKLTSNVCSR